MKIKGTLGDVQQDAVKISRQSQTAKEHGSKAVEREESKAKSSDSVDVTVAKMISDQFDPTKMAAERRDKIERLKKLIASGDYKPSSLDIAQAVEQELDFEILSADDVKGVSN
jgi:anti-sigma28 factor (negative regulator of flagellin synthesis)